MGILAFFKKLLGMENEGGTSFKNGNGNENFEDARLVCAECRREFVFEAGERKFYKQRGLTPPKRCPPCRSKRKRGRRIYGRAGNLPKVMNNYGIAVISTSRGIMTNKEARKLNVGGEVICEIY